MALSAWPRSRAACGGRRGREAARSRRTARRAACRAASTALREASSTINQEVVLFLMKLDLSTQLQRAITMQSQEAVQLIQQNLEEIEQLLQETETTKRANAAGESPNGGLQAGQKQQQEEAVDPVARGLMLRSELQRAIEAEDYPAAARVRDELAKLEAASFASEAAAAVRRSVQASVDLFLGQKIVHKNEGYRGLICGFDRECCESAEWRNEVGIDELQNGTSQPFYHVLVEMSSGQYSIAYVPQENLTAADSDVDEFAHPYTYLLFLGMQSDGSYIPSKQLRERFGAERRDDIEDDDEEEGDGGSAGDGQGDGGDTLGV